MESQSKIISLLLGLLLLFPSVALAACSPTGKTVAYINGINTNIQDAGDEALALRRKLSGENLAVINVYNPTTGSLVGQGGLAKFLDGFGVTKQLLYWRDDVWNEDPKGDVILNELRGQLKTQQVMLVGHSQGALYANETYKYLIAHGLSAASVGNFDIATPASYVAGGGGYITSTNDTIINKVRSANKTPGLGAIRMPLPGNVTIPLNSTDSTGHLFYTYLNGDSYDIVSGIESGLGNLAPTTNKDLGECFTAPDNSTLNKIGVSFGNITAGLGTVEYVAAASLYNGTIAAAGAALDAAHQVIVDVGTAVGGINGLAHSGETQYGSTNLNIVQHLYGGANEQVDGENLHDLLNGGAVILSTVQADVPADNPAPTGGAHTSTTPSAPAVPIGPAPGFSPGGGGSAPAPVAADPAPQDQTAATAVVGDTIAPVFTTVSDVSQQTADASATSSVVSYSTPVATDDTDGAVAVSCTPQSGSDFALGTTTVTCTASDTAGNVASTTFNVGIYLPPIPPPATEPLVINEIAWGGSYGAPSEQWIELYNNGNDDVSLDDIVLSATDGSMYIPLSGTIGAHGYYILGSSDNSIFNGKNSGWNYQTDARLALSPTPVQLVLSRINSSATTTLDQTPDADACGGSWCAGAAAATDGYSAAGGYPPVPVTMERVSVSVPGSDSSNWASADGYSYYANDFNQQRIIGTPYNPNSSHWPMTGFVCAGDTSVLAPGSNYTYRPTSNDCHYLSGYVGRDWTAEGVLLKGTIGSSTIVTRMSAGSGPYKDLRTDASHTYDFANANSGDTFTVVFFNYNNTVGGQYNAYYVGDMLHYLETGVQNDGTTASAPYQYQTLSFVIP